MSKLSFSETETKELTMCDETTERELDTYLKRKPLTRRGFTVSAIAAGSLAPAACATLKNETNDLTETEVSVPTADGEADAPVSYTHLTLPTICSV